jgi:hypothetical protein
MGECDMFSSCFLCGGCPIFKEQHLAPVEDLLASTLTTFPNLLRSTSCPHLFTSLLSLLLGNLQRHQAVFFLHFVQDERLFLPQGSYAVSLGIDCYGLSRG